jgi:hypothetical protein
MLMFLRLPFQFDAHAVHTVLILNTVILISMLVIMELVYSERPKADRKYLALLYPFIVVLVGLLFYAVHQQK